MSMKKIAPLALSALLLGSVAAYAEQPTTEGVQETMKQSAFVQQTGKVTAVENFGEGKLFIVDQQDNLFHFYVDEKTLVFDNTGKKVDVKVGDTISLSIYANQPMIMIYPPRYTPPVVIVQTEQAGFVKVDQFDENNVSFDGELKLNINEETVIENAKGEKVAASELKNYSALVFYGPTTRSLPPQTAPEKIVVFPTLEDLYAQPTPDIAPEIAKIIGDDYKEVDGQIMVPLRKVAEELGFKVASTGKGAIISKGALSYTITRGDTTYGYNKALGKFEVAPQLLEKNKTYVEYSFALELLK